MKRLCLLIALLFLMPCEALAQESYADVEIMIPPHWDMSQMQTFSGAAPSRAWLFSKGEEEVMVAALVTEGIMGGLAGQDNTALAKLYLEGVIRGWGGTRPEPKEGQEGAGNPGAAFCAGEAGYKLPAVFGEKAFDYYCCFMVNPEKTRIATITTWVPAGTEEQIAARRLMTFVQAVMFRQ